MATQNGFVEVRHGLLLAVLLSLFAAHARGAQSHVRGHVISHLTGAPVVNAFVEIRRADATRLPGQYATTDTEGAYSWSGDCPDASGPTCIAYMYTSDFFTSPLYESLQAPFANGAADAVVDFEPHALGALRGTATGPNGAPWPMSSTLLPEQLPQPEDLVPPIALFRFDAPSSAWQRVDLPAGNFAAGHFFVSALPAGRYRLCLGGIDAQLQRQCFDHQPEAGSWAKQTFTDIDLAEGEERNDLHFDLVAGGGISGTVADAHKQQPLATDAPRTLVRVRLYDEDGVLFDHGTTYLHQDSRFHIAGTPKGRFRVVTGLIDLAYLEQHVLFPDIPCTSACPLRYGREVATDVNGEVSGIDLNVHPSVTIRGRVTDVDRQLPIANAVVSDWWLLPSTFAGTPPPPFHVTHSARTDANGDYEVYVQPATSVEVGAAAPRYLPTCVPGPASTCPALVGDINTRAGDVISGVDIGLRMGAFFSGSITDAWTGQGVSANVYIFDASGQSVTALTYGGAYESPPLAAGTYYVMAAADSTYPWRAGRCQVYMARRCPLVSESILDVTPTPVVVDYGATRSGVNFQLLTDPVFTNGFE